MCGHVKRVVFVCKTEFKVCERVQVCIFIFIFIVIFIINPGNKNNTMQVNNIPKVTTTNSFKVKE